MTMADRSVNVSAAGTERVDPHTRLAALATSPSTVEVAAVGHLQLAATLLTAHGPLGRLLDLANGATVLGPPAVP
jgi:hypothetical protein